MPTYPSLTNSYEDRLTLHFQEVGEKRLNAQAWPRSPLLEVLQANAKPYDGGAYMTELLEDGYTPTGRAFGEGSTLPVAQHNISLPAMYTPVFYYEDVYLDGVRRMKIDTRGSMGPLIRWAEEQAQAATRRARESIAIDVVLTTAGTEADGSSMINSVFDVVKTTGSLGNVDPTQFAWWKGTVETTSGAWTSTGIGRLRTALRQSKRYTGFSGPDVFFASATTIDAMKASGYSKTTFFRAPDASGKPMDVGDGKTQWTAHTPYDPDCVVDGLPVYYDSHLDGLESSSLSTGGILLGLNTKAVFLRQRPGTVFTIEPWQKSEQRHGEFTRVIWAGQLVAKNRNSNVLLTNIL